MTEPYGYDEDPNDDQNDSDDEQKFVRLPRKNIRTLERDAKTAREATERANMLERRLALAESGVTGLTDRQRNALFADLGNSEITPETVRAAAEELGFVQPPPTAPAAEEQQAMERMSQASAGATDPGSEDSIAEMEKAAEQGYDALLAHLRSKGHDIVTAG